MMKTIKSVKIAGYAVKYIVLLLFAVIFLFPVAEMILKAFMSDLDIRFGELFPTSFEFLS